MLLAYELYKAYKTDENQTARVQPIKKVYCRAGGRIEIDQTTLEEYGSGIDKKTKELQEWLLMPLNTANPEKINLPDYRTGSASLKPYIDVSGMLEKNKSKIELSLRIGESKSANRPNSKYIRHVLDLETGEIKKESSGTLELRLDEEKYFAGSNTMFEEYVKSEIVSKDKVLNADMYEKIVRRFMRYAYNSKPDNLLARTSTFRLYILPNDTPVKYKDQATDGQQGKLFTDCFGVKAKSYASSATQHTKFLTFDDPAFTLNCKNGVVFYKNLGIGDVSHKKIHINSSKTFNISGLDWTFLNMNQPDKIYGSGGSGILATLHRAYSELKKEDATTTAPSLKVLCIKRAQAKQEVLIDENLTLDRLDSMFAPLGNEGIPPSCFEVLIYKSGKNPLWSAYLQMVRGIIVGNDIPRRDIVSILTKILRAKPSLFKDPKEAHDFFKKSQFCLKYLLSTAASQQDDTMKKNEEFAEKAGKIARLYVDFKKGGPEDNNSLSDILTYPRYDRVKLRFVLQRVQLGIQLSKITRGKDDLIRKVDKLRPDTEIDEGHASDDLSYFFFKGYHTPLENEVVAS